jgi:hypothetical protein
LLFFAAPDDPGEGLDGAETCTASTEVYSFAADQNANAEDTIESLYSTREW